LDEDSHVSSAKRSATVLAWTAVITFGTLATSFGCSTLEAKPKKVAVKTAKKAPKTAPKSKTAQPSGNPATGAASKTSKANGAQPTGTFPPCTRSGPVRIMPIGDSLTVGLHWDSSNDDSYRPYLWQYLQQNGFTDIDFVGTMTTGDGTAYDGDHNGFGGFSTGPDNGFADANGKNTNNLATYIEQYTPWEGSKNTGTGQDIVTFSDPDIVLLNVGTNDGESDPKLIARRLSGLVQTIRTKAPEAIVIVSSITPNDNPVLELVGQQARQIAATSDGRVLFADIRSKMIEGNSALGAAPFSSDDWQSSTDQHMSTSGGKKFGAAWYPTVVEALGMGRCRSGSPTR
jgi:lysophospholipase L1-like esterase